MSTLRMLAMLTVIVLVAVSVSAQDTTSALIPVSGATVTVMVEPGAKVVGKFPTDPSGKICFALPRGTVIGPNTWFCFIIDPAAIKRTEGILDAVLTKICIPPPRILQGNIYCINVWYLRPKTRSVQGGFAVSGRNTS